MKSLIWSFHFLIVVKYKILKVLHLNKVKKESFRILLYHDVSNEIEGRFVNQIRSCTKSWEFIDPKLIGKFVGTSGLATGHNVMLTFDDGFASDFRIAQEILNPRGIKAVFFVIPQFLDLRDEIEQKDFISRQLYPGVSNRRVPQKLRSMNWEQVALLHKQGHTIGSHTYSHKKLSEISDLEELSFEIIQSGKVIGDLIGEPVKHFAFTFGNLSSISHRALEIARANYEFVYSGLHGSNSSLVSQSILRRETIHPWDPKGFELAILSGAADFRSSKSLLILDNMFQNNLVVNSH